MDKSAGPVTEVAHAGETQAGVDETPGVGPVGVATGPVGLETPPRPERLATGVAVPAGASSTIHGIVVNSCGSGMIRSTGSARGTGR